MTPITNLLHFDYVLVLNKCYHQYICNDTNNLVSFSVTCDTTVGANKTSYPHNVPGPRYNVPHCPGQTGNIVPHCPSRQGTLYRIARGSAVQCTLSAWGKRYIVPGQTRYNAGVARFVCPDCMWGNTVAIFLNMTPVYTVYSNNILYISYDSS